MTEIIGKQDGLCDYVIWDEPGEIVIIAHDGISLTSFEEVQQFINNIELAAERANCD